MPAARSKTPENPYDNACAVETIPTLTKRCFQILFSVNNSSISFKRSLKERMKL